MPSSNTEPQPAQPTARPAAGVIRVLLADDHRVTLWGLQQLVESAHPRMQVVGTATTCAELLAHAALGDADVLLLDLDLGGTSSVTVLGDLAQRTSAKVLVLTAEEDLAVHRDVVVKGARGVLHKSAPADMVLRAIEKVAAGEVWLDGKLMADVLGMITGRRAAPRTEDPHARRIASLTPREREIVNVMTRSAGDKLLAVADALGMSEHTLRNHLTTIYSKLEVRGRLELHVLVTEHGLDVDASE